jgi:neutral ceramidase
MARSSAARTALSGLRRVAAVALSIPLAHSLAGAEMMMGVAVRDITPPVGYRMSGYFHERVSTGTHDPLSAKALVLEQNGTAAALVFCDLIGLNREVTDQARELASAATKIPASNILIAATHSHTGPLYDGVLRDFFHTRAVAGHGHDPLEKIIDYPKWLANRLADAIVAAHKSAAAAQVTAASVDQPGLSFNRRFHMKDGSVRFNPGPLNPDIVRVAGPIDPEVSVLRFQPVGGTTPVQLTVFALHLDTVGGTEYSADYPGYLARANPAVVSLFGSGACGDLNHIDVTRTDQPKGQAMARHLGETLHATLASAPPGPALTPQLAVKSTMVPCPLQRFTPEQAAQAQASMSQVGGGDLPFLAQVEACKILALQSIAQDTLACEVQVFRLSDTTAVVGLPGEIFVELGLAIKAASPFEHTVVIELCNDAPAYIPTRKAFAEGSYETVNSLVAPGGGELLVDAAVGLLHDVKAVR